MRRLDGVRDTVAHTDNSQPFKERGRRLRVSEQKWNKHRDILRQRAEFSVQVESGPRDGAAEAFLLISRSSCWYFRFAHQDERRHLVVLPHGVVEKYEPSGPCADRNAVTRGDDFHVDVIAVNDDRGHAKLRFYLPA